MTSSMDISQEKIEYKELDIIDKKNIHKTFFCNP